MTGAQFAILGYTIGLVLLLGYAAGLIRLNRQIARRERARAEWKG